MLIFALTLTVEYTTIHSAVYLACVFLESNRITKLNGQQFLMLTVTGEPSGNLRGSWEQRALIVGNNSGHNVLALKEKAHQDLVALATLYHTAQVAGQARETEEAKRLDISRFLAFYYDPFRHSRYRSVANFLVNLVVGLIAYMYHRFSYQRVAVRRESGDAGVPT